MKNPPPPMLPRRLRRGFAAGLLAVLLALTAPARALDIQLISGDWQPINIFVEVFTGEELLPDNLPSEIIGNDLSRSGQFRVFRETINTFGSIDEARLNDIAQKGGEYLLTGTVRQQQNRQYSLQFYLHDILTGNVVGNYQVAFIPDNQRTAAHQISNWIYETVIGRAGVFHTKMLYVLRHPDGNSVLKIADYDGFNRQSILQSKDRIISPAWSPDGNDIVYVSFERNKPIIYRQSLLTGERQIVANFKGSNSAPVVAPNNYQIAAALTEHGGEQQLYLIEKTGKQRIRESDGINTEPFFSPDGERIAFASDEAGSLQIYETVIESGDTRRLTYGSSYNASPQYSSDGKNIVFVRRDDNGDNIALLDLASGGQAVLTDIRFADSPSFSPNNDIILFKDENKKNNLATLSINGKVIIFWENPEEGEIIDPAWGPARSDWF